MDKLHYIHSRAGRIGARADTSAADVDAIVAKLRSDARKHLVIHFHGGLVSKESGLELAERLLPVYQAGGKQGGYPLFFVWESGAWETIRNNFTELADEPVFKELLRKIVQYALERVGASDPFGLGRSATPGSTGSRETEVKKAFKQFWNAPSPQTIPYHGTTPSSPGQARSVSDIVDDSEILADLEQDTEVKKALATLPDLPPGTRSTFGGGQATERRSAFSEVAAHEFSKQSGTRGLVELYTVAKYLAKVLRAVIKRYRSGRDHGIYATSVEELVRAFKIAGSSVNEWGKALQWNRMKQDTIDAFDPDPNLHAGTALLSRLKTAIDSGWDLQRITLVGHSTGAIYIANWLENAARFLPATLKHDVVFLAPAITYQRFATMLTKCQANVGKFRMFAMQDALEREDQVWGSDDELAEQRDWRRFIYPSSLLYLVSGILESRLEDGKLIDEFDAPLVGMQRYFEDRDTYSAANFPEIEQVRVWLATVADSLVWSKTDNAGAGLGSSSNDHGAFDNDAETLQSLRHILG
ncbi:hypothetical protein [Steroidobacter sp.]|uniref:hypothetical protein n=1 Tax=Steroidobacter sp. TaxID=1978227 RepID=UPI001A63AD8E|nr:hypothetical protein [Steroidobacter sp.]MBL8264850.1 hypothetical protein [Steroidobacter sp.]